LFAYMLSVRIEHRRASKKLPVKNSAAIVRLLFGKQVRRAALLP
jgi:hypothetical protein